MNANNASKYVIDRLPSEIYKTIGTKDSQTVEIIKLIVEAVLLEIKKGDVVTTGLPVTVATPLGPGTGTVNANTKII